MLNNEYRCTNQVDLLGSEKALSNLRFINILVILKLNYFLLLLYWNLFAISQRYFVLKDRVGWYENLDNLCERENNFQFLIYNNV